MPTLHELNDQLSAKQKQWKELQESFPTKTLPDGTTAPDIPAEKVADLRDRMAEMKTLGEQRDALNAVELANAEVKRREDEMKQATNRLSIGTGTVTSNQQTKSLYGHYQDFAKKDSPLRVTAGSNQSWGFHAEDVDPIEWLASTRGVKTLMTTSSDGYPPEVLRTPGVTLSIQRPVQFLDVLPMRTTTQNGLKFMTETVLTDTADAQTEGGAVTDSVFTYAESTGAIRKIGAYITMTEEQIADEPGIQSFIEGRLVFTVRRELDREALVGTGGANITGLYNASGISTQAKGSDPIFDCAYKAMTKVRVDGRTTPELFVLHSTTWQSVRLTRTSDGVYIFGSPLDGDTMRMWGLPVYLNEELTGTAGSGTGLCAGVSEHVTLVMRSGVEVAISDSATTADFMKSILTMRATVRAGLEVRRAKTGCTMTGL